jgi:DNA replication protein DnaC
MNLLDFIGEYFPHIDTADFGKKDNLRCRYCGKIVYSSGKVLSCCEQMKISKMERIKENREQEEREKELERSQKNYTFNFNMQDSGMQGFEVGVNFRTYRTEGNPKLEIAKNLCRDFAKNDKTTLVLSGNVGTGKTHLACATAKYIGYYREKSFGILRCSHPNTREVEKFLNFDVLVIDDIGREIGTEARIKSAVSMISEVIDHRHRNRMKTIYTTNLELLELTEKYGSHIVDRMLENSMVAEKFEGDSQRGIK